eukprot:CAMPEP_0203750226 /NCGR_PEP_ID=MMETSP0098-20131031/4483_1 /ASSEMBLY_ACC=CAM_ASM_000208 /TAXON_ID=96639 /ORGANISM=" , Strain NY0313808BC1" /LENGTH=611 /DNA_ID=CAMNT_0050639417 /DNA_START=31 /DNA_END=1863 /DNA_ORIENTATION=-
MDAIVQGLSQQVVAGSHEREAIEALCEHFRSTNAAPPVDELEAVLRVRFTEERARALLFEPSVEEVKFYALLVCSPPDNAPHEHPQIKLQHLFLTLFYMVHVHRPKLAVEFVLHGGLASLAALVVHENLVIRAQAIEAILVITGSEDFDWFAESPSHAQFQLHQCMLALTRTTFLADLVANYDHSFPGGSYLCLQIIGFYLSWLRKFYCKDNIIRVSKQIIDTFQSWSERLDVSAEERDFAKQLFEDFKRFPAKANGEESSNFLSKHNDFSTESCPTTPPKPPANEVLVNDAPIVEELSLRAQGNAHFAQGEYTKALELYTQAIESKTETDSAVQIARLYGNRAAVFMELQKKNNDGGYMQQCIDDCKQSLQHDPSYIKAYYRLTQAFLEGGDLEQAKVFAMKGKQLCTEKREQDTFAVLLKSIAFASQESDERRAELDDIYQAILKRYGFETKAPIPAGKKKNIQIDNSDENRKQQATVEESRTMHAPEKKKKAIKVKKVKKKRVSFQHLTGDDFEARANYLLKIGDENDFRALFGDNLDERQFAAIIDTVDSMLPQNPAMALVILQNLGAVNRFSVVLMFLENSTRSRIKSLFSMLEPLVGGDLKATVH